MLTVTWEAVRTAIVWCHRVIYEGVYLWCIQLWKKHQWFAGSPSSISGKYLICKLSEDIAQTTHHVTFVLYPRPNDAWCAISSPKGSRWNFSPTMTRSFLSHRLCHWATRSDGGGREVLTHPLSFLFQLFPLFLPFSHSFRLPLLLPANHCGGSRNGRTG